MEIVSGNQQQQEVGSELQESKKVQAEHFPEEIAGKETNLSRNLGLFLDVDGILRCQGRLKYTDWNYEMKHPALIPRKCSFTEKIIKRVHEDNYHVGTSHTLSLIRQKHWIPQGTAQVQKIILRCPQCVRHGGGPYQLPSAPALAPERVKYSPPFTYTEVHYFGPMITFTPYGSSKRWICLFTCLAVRAVHMELVNDLTAEECVLAFRRFIASRGLPTLVVSDNALYFKLTSEIMAGDYGTQSNLKWEFIPNLAPWHGGFYERLVGLVKHCLKRSLGKHQLNDLKLNTIIKEVESVINTRPLTPVCSELDYVLKPSDFLSLGRCLTLNMPPETTDKLTTTKRELIQGWKRGNIILEEFKEMFTNRYLTALRERYSSNHKQPRVKSGRKPCIGDVVQLKGRQKNRELWRTGRIFSLIRGLDGECRVAKVKIGNDELVRSTGHLYPLEVEDKDEIEGCAGRKSPCIKESTEESIVDTEQHMEDDVSKGVDDLLKLRKVLLTTRV